MIRVECIEALNLPSKILFKTGTLHTENLTKVDVTRIILNYFFHATLLAFCVLNITNAIKTNNENHAYWIASVLIPLITYITKTIAPLSRKRSLITVFKYLRSDSFNGHNQKLNRHIQLINRLSTYILYYFIVAVMVGVMLFGILPFFINVQVLILAPFDTGRYEFVYKMFHLLSLCYICTNSVCLDVFNMTLMALAIAQFNILQERLSNVVEDAHAETMKSRSSTTTLTMQRIVKQCVIQFEAIHQYVQKVNDVLAFPLSVQYLGGCFAVCSAMLQITIMNMSHNKLLSNIVSYCGVTFAQMTAYHWLANEIMYKSDKVTESCYLSRWYELDASSQKTLVLLMERAKKPLTLRLYSFISISLDSLAVTVRWSYSIFALIKAKYG